MFLEVFLVFAMGVVMYNIHKTKKVNKNVKILERDNQNLSEAFLLPMFSEFESGEYLEHSWFNQSVETIHHDIFSMSVVKINTKFCKKCNMVHRHIYSGYTLAKNKGLSDIEGFYANGIKCFDKGCKR